MTTKILLLLAVIATAATAALAAPSGAEARGYTCSYTRVGVVVTIDGNANASFWCRMFNGSFHGRRVASHAGGAYCGWRLRSMDVRVIVSSSSAALGHLFCRGMASKLDAGDWRRVL